MTLYINQKTLNHLQKKDIRTINYAPRCENKAPCVTRTLRLNPLRPGQEAGSGTSAAWLPGEQLVLLGAHSTQSGSRKTNRDSAM